ncbi:MAG TPA: PTS sugar transporter subunit IIA [Phycisphaerae bacterium]|nr:PTS sugar transporter subunit IIA [Phycisphaerae bacterium]
MHLADILSVQCINPRMAAKDKASAIAEMVDMVDAAGKLLDRDQMLAATMEREATRTTGIGSGLAIPHGKCAAARELVMAIGRPAEPLEFGSIDGKPVQIIIFLASPPDKTGPHIQALARISRLMTDPLFRHALADARTADEIYQLIARSDHDVER